MLYPELFKQLEAVRWNMDKDIPWDQFDAGRLSDEQAQTIKMNAITEWAALPATEMFLRDNRDDSDFSAFMSVWFFEEQKHSLVLMEYLRRFRPDLVPTEAELHEVRFEFDPAPALETLMLHFCGEIRLNHWYRRAAEWHSEPVIKAIYETLARDEARHGGAYLRYMKRAMQKFGDEARAAFAKVGVLMASARRTAQALHPTNLHVNVKLFPRDTVQSRLPDPEWLEQWLDQQIQFDAVWETKVVERILHNLSLLMERSFASVQELNRYRKEVLATLAAAATGRARRRNPPEAAARQRPWLWRRLAVGQHPLRARPLADELAVRLPVDAAGGEQVLAVDHLASSQRQQRQAGPRGAVGLRELVAGDVGRELREALERRHVFSTSRLRMRAPLPLR